MNESQYQPDVPADAIDLAIVAGSGPEPHFDVVMQDVLIERYSELQRNCQRGGLLDYASLGRANPWLYRLRFGTHGFVRQGDGEVTKIDRHVVALRFMPDYLRNAERFAMLRMVEPVGGIFHPNIASNGAICVQIYAGEPLIEICQSLHDLFRWRLRQYDERDALNPAACAWGRLNIDRPIDSRPLFGQGLKLQWQNAEDV